MKIWPNLTQGSEQWHAARTGKLTASNASKIITAGGKTSAQRTSYLDELISDCFCPGQNAWHGNANTDRGTAMEPLARAAFESRLSLEVEEIGFVTREDGVIGCSPDGLISRGSGNYISGLEIKCPLPKTHFRYLLEGVLPDTYKPQVHFSMMVTGLPWHFFSYCPGMKPLHLFIEPDTYTLQLRTIVEDFVSEYADMWEKAKSFREDAP
jgi:YqaJ-like viral recombinase domain